MKLYSYFRSSAAYRLRIALALKGLPYDYAAVNLLREEQRSEAYRALNPMGLVPALATEEGELLTQSVAILEWLEESYPEPPLLPAQPLARARVRAVVNNDSSKPGAGRETARAVVHDCSIFRLSKRSVGQVLRRLRP